MEEEDEKQKKMELNEKGFISEDLKKKRLRIKMRKKQRRQVQHALLESHRDQVMMNNVNNPNQVGDLNNMNNMNGVQVDRESSMKSMINDRDRGLSNSEGDYTMSDIKNDVLDKVKKRGVFKPSPLEDGTPTVKKKLKRTSHKAKLYQPRGYRKFRKINRGDKRDGEGLNVPDYKKQKKSRDKIKYNVKFDTWRL